MSRTCPPEHERWLVAALADGPQTLGASERSALEACPRCAEEWRELVDLRARVEGAATSEREDLSFALRTAGAGEERFVRTALAPYVRPAKRRRSVPWPLLATLATLAAVALLLLWLRQRGGEAPRPTPDVLLGERAIVLTATGNGHVADRLEWTDTQFDGFGYRVKVWPTDGDEADSVLDRVTTETFLDLESEELARWPAHAWVKVIALGRDQKAVPGIVDRVELSR